MAAFNRSLMLSNINFLVKEKGIRIGDLEANANVSAGYFSRLNKEDSKASPSIEVLCTVADILQVTVDDLVSVDFSNLNPTQKYVLAFINKMILDTHKDKAEWNCESADELNNMQTDYDGNPLHPLFTFETYSDDRYDKDAEKISRVLFRSYGYNFNTKAYGTWYNMRLKNGVYVYVVHVGMYHFAETSHDVESKEMWLYHPQTGLQFICGSIAQGVFSVKLEKLYSEIEKAELRPHIRKELRYAVDAYLNNDVTDDPPELDLPF